MMIKHYAEIDQGSEEWLELRCGMITASEMKLILTPTLKIASNDKERQHLYELIAQRINDYVEPHYISDDMLRGKDDEIDAKILYNEKVAPVIDMGFITNDPFGVKIGYSPDGLIGEEGLIEAKSRRQKYHAETIINQKVPDEYMLQIQTGLLVSERKWCDFISYCGGMPMLVLRVFPDSIIQDAICEASSSFEARIKEKLADYERIVSDPNKKLFKTKRKIQQEITI